MFRNYVSAALGNIGRNKVHAGITILGLSISFAAAILIGLFLRDEARFERFIPGHERVYRLETDTIVAGQKPQSSDRSVSTAAGFLALDFPEVERTARLVDIDVSLRRRDFANAEALLWATPDFFKVMPYPVLAGDPNAALQAPDGLVLTRSAARKYFGEDAPIGKVLEVNTALDMSSAAPPGLVRMFSTYHPMRVLAVLEDQPNTHLRAQVFASSRSPASLISLESPNPSPTQTVEWTYVKLKPGANIEAVRARLAAFASRRYPGPNGGPSSVAFHLQPLDGLHFSPPSAFVTDALREPGDRRVDQGVAGEGLLVVLIAAINFVTLMTARAGRRAVEVGVRKATGARRRDLFVQFMGETLIYGMAAMVVGVVLAELALQPLNAFLQRNLAFDYLHEPALLAAILGAALLTTLLAGLYPALVLSAFRPAAALKGATLNPTGSPVARQGLVAVQFAIVIGLLLVTGTVYRQTRFALSEAMRLDASQLVWMQAPCRSAFSGQVAGLPGVRGVSCATVGSLGMGNLPTQAVLPDGSTRTLNRAALDVGLFELHGLKPLAGRFFSPSFGEDMVLAQASPGPHPELQPAVVLNESAARLLGYGKPADAVGKTLRWFRPAAPGSSVRPPAAPSRIVGIAPDFTLGSIRKAIAPSVYYVDPVRSQDLVVKLDGAAMPETLKAMDELWRRTGHERVLGYAFESASVQDLYHDVITEGAAIAACAGLALVIACLGLFALAAFVTERRTKEIGVRKAMGASSVDVVRLLLWQFTQPVLWANLVAWPGAFFVMDWWLHGFAYRVSQPLWLFAAAAASAAVIAWATVSFQSWMAARARPATALRCE
jgi:putative ABC transport system permease protein